MDPFLLPKGAEIDKFASDLERISNELGRQYFERNTIEDAQSYSVEFRPIRCYFESEKSSDPKKIQTIFERTIALPLFKAVVKGKIFRATGYAIDNEFYVDLDGRQGSPFLNLETVHAKKELSAVLNSSSIAPLSDRASAAFWEDWGAVYLSKRN